jgi:hypothetical protein
MGWGHRRSLGRSKQMIDFVVGETARARISVSTRRSSIPAPWNSRSAFESAARVWVLPGYAATAVEWTNPVVARRLTSRRRGLRHCTLARRAASGRIRNSFRPALLQRMPYSPDTSPRPEASSASCTAARPMFSVAHKGACRSHCCWCSSCRKRPGSVPGSDTPRSANRTACRAGSRHRSHKRPSSSR